MKMRVPSMAVLITAALAVIGGYTVLRRPEAAPVRELLREALGPCVSDAPPRLPPSIDHDRRRRYYAPLYDREPNEILASLEACDLKSTELSLVSGALEMEEKRRHEHLRLAAVLPAESERRLYRESEARKCSAAIVRLRREQHRARIIAAEQLREGMVLDRAAAAATEPSWVYWIERCIAALERGTKKLRSPTPETVP